MPVPVGWDVASAAERYRAGRTLRQLAAELGRSTTTIRTQLVKAGVVMRPVRLPLGRPEVSTAEIIRLREQAHLTWPEIAERVGMSAPGVVSRYQRAQAPSPRRSKSRRSKSRQYPDRAAPRPWRGILTDALEEHSVVSVRLTVAHHLGRTPTRAEITAARRAAHRLADSGQATVLRVEPLDPGPGSANLLLAQPGTRVGREHLVEIAAGIEGKPAASTVIAEELAAAVKAAAEAVQVIGVEDLDPNAVRRLTAVVDAALKELRRVRRRLTSS